MEGSSNTSCICLKKSSSLVFAAVIGADPVRLRKSTVGGPQTLVYISFRICPTILFIVSMSSLVFWSGFLGQNPLASERFGGGFRQVLHTYVSEFPQLLSLFVSMSSLVFWSSFFWGKSFSFPKGSVEGSVNSFTLTFDFDPVCRAAAHLGHRK